MPVPKKFLLPSALVIAAVAIFVIVNFSPSGSSGSSRYGDVVNMTIGTGNDTHPAWLRVAKTSGGNEIYDSMGAIAWISPRPGEYRIDFTGFCTASSRAPGDSTATGSIKSQSFEIMSVKNAGIGVGYTKDGYRAWPHSGGEAGLEWYGEPMKSGMEELGHALAGELNASTRFPYGGEDWLSGLKGKFDGGMDGPEVKSFEWTYSGVSDCAHAFDFMLMIPAGKTAEFDLVSTTNRGMSGTSNVSLHFRVTVPQTNSGKQLVIEVS